MIRWIRLLLTTAVLSSCRDSPIQEEAVASIEWHEATYGLEDYKEMQPGRPILAIFVSDWDLTGQLIRKVFEDETSMSILRDSRFLCLWYDCTESYSLGMIELKRLKQVSVPVAVFVSGVTAKERFFEPPVSKDEVYGCLKNLRIEAEQVAASDR